MTPRNQATTHTTAPAPATAPAPTAPTPSASTAITGPHATDEAALAALTEATDGDILYDGFSGSLSPDKFRVPRRVFNQSKGTDANGVRLSVDMFYDPVSETAAKRIDAILILEHTTRAFTQYDEAKDETTYICMSNDCATGIEQATGKERKCRGCPDASWRRGADGRRTVNCNESHNVLAVDMATREPFILAFRRSSAQVIIAHLQRYHLGKLELSGGRKGNMPLYFRRVELSLELSDNGKYAIPVIGVTGIVSVEDMQMCRETLEAYRPILTHAADHERATAVDASGAGGDASFDPASKDFYRG